MPYPHDDPRTQNSYDFVRFFAASCVLYSHHFDLAGFDEPIVPGYRADFGQFGVAIFFALSGFLICQSLQRSTDWVRFFAARFFRIMPNLAFVLIVSSLTTLIWYRNGAHLSAHTSYVAENLAMFVRGVTKFIPGVFGNAERQDINDPLWTLPYEFWLYVLLAALFFVGRRFSGIAVTIAALAIAAIWLYCQSEDVDFMLGPLESDDLFRLSAYFLAGSLLAILWPHISRFAIPLGIAGLVVAFTVRRVTDEETALSAIALAAAVIGLGSTKLLAWFARGGDASYGIYVFAWPVQQFALLLVGAFWPSMALAFVITVAIGYATWHSFEKRAMTLPARISRAAHARA
ncbi:acyltransferase family protein [Variibacter gotjawalensis]|uniref:Acyltransferase family protein n=1 Tax=Variibacter gotjawalensis TaxID=1333996 RepID=A0A0S3PXN2_9BRAD|nr:acyltransferase [Variibacter gotjawalensis]NIK46532.1 peptidoglycan/LPS O-acetylase OafA/YrhL [Variibacter gotjawalensis]RZS48437.1 peptidoglycan/LPS O-acetylase OafA/YrhL [Variibacter gotjawalensis]BAT60698.1 acyltransferase family protein [Variibacter gotjawalensis]